VHGSWECKPHFQLLTALWNCGGLGWLGSQVPEIAQLYKTNRAKYEETAREWTRKYASG